MRKLFFAAAITLVAASCGGDKETIAGSGVFPPSSYLGKESEVVVFATGTNWGADASLNFGPGVTVLGTRTENSTTIIANVRVELDAALGEREVTVDGDAVEGTFLVESPLSVEVLGTQAQGSVLVMEVTNLDLERPFDTTTVPVGLFDVAYTNFEGTFGDASAGVVPISVNPFDAELLVTIDVTAPAGPRSLVLLSGPEGTKTGFAAPDLATIAERTAAELPTANPTTGTQPAPLASMLYKVTASELALFEMSVTADDEMASAALVLLPESGSFAELKGQGAQHLFTGDSTSYVIFWDGSPLSGYGYSITVGATALQAMSESEPNASDAPEELTLPVQAASGFANVTDEDWFQVVVAENETVLNILTEGGDAATDTKLFLYKEGDLATVVAESDDGGFHEFLATEPLDADTYLIKVVWSPDFADAWDGVATEYNATFWLD